MREQRRLPPHRLIQAQMARRAWQPLFAAQHMRYPHCAVVNHMRQMIRREAIRLQHHEVIHKPILEGNIAPYQVVHSGRAVHGHLEAHRRRIPIRRKRLPFRVYQIAAAAVRAAFALRPRLSRRIRPLGTAVAFVGEPFAQQFIRGVLVERQPLRLPIGGVRTAHARTFIPIYAQPLQRF